MSDAIHNDGQLCYHTPIFCSKSTVDHPGSPHGYKLNAGITTCRLGITQMAHALIISCRPCPPHPSQQKARREIPCFLISYSSKAPDLGVLALPRRHEESQLR